SLAHTNGILRAVRRRGFDVTLWSTGDIAALPAGLPVRRLPHVLVGNLPTEVAELLSGLRQARTLLRTERERPALVYQRYSLNNLAGLVLARRWGVPLVLEANCAEARWRAT